MAEYNGALEKEQTRIPIAPTRMENASFDNRSVGERGNGDKALSGTCREGIVERACVLV